MKKLILAVLAVGVLTGGTVWLWRACRGDEYRIVRVLKDCADAAGFRADEAPAGALLKLRRLEKALDDEVDITLRRGRIVHDRMARKTILAQLATARRQFTHLRFELGDMAIVVSGDTAAVNAAVRVDGAWRNSAPGGESAMEEVDFTMVRRDGRWKISAVKARDFLEK